MRLRAYNAINIVLGTGMVLDGLYWMGKVYYPFTSSSLSAAFTGAGATDQQLVGFPIDNIIIPILPVSILILGLFMFALSYFNPKIAVPLWLMGCGAFDIMGDADPNVISRVMGSIQGSHDFWVFFQLALMFGGWLLAGLPKFKANWWLGLVVIMLILTPGFGGDGRPFEIALFAYIATSTIPRLWGKEESDEAETIW